MEYGGDGHTADGSMRNDSFNISMKLTIVKEPIDFFYKKFEHEESQKARFSRGV